MQKTALFTRIALFTLAALIATAATGERPGDWSLSVGPAWRSKVKSAISGQAGGPTVTPSRRVIYDKDVVTRRPWSADEVEIVQDPDYPGQQDFLNYAAVQTGSETIVTPLYGAAELNSSNRDRPLGVSLTAGRDLYTAGCFSAGLTLRFAGYWDMKTQASGMAGCGTIQSRSWRDYYLFKDGPIPPYDDDFTYCYPEPEPYAPYHQNLGSSTRTIPGQPIHARLTSDLYQIGLGPRLTCRIGSRLDIFGAVEALCNIARMDIECADECRSKTESPLGLAARVGIAAYLTENIGLQAEAGQEWIDDADITLGDIRAKADYSSFVLSAGLIARF